MPTIAIISQKGGAGKTTLALHLAAAAEDSGHTALVIDVDPQATASQWAAWRQDAPPVVIDSAPPRLAAKIEQATGQGAAFIVIDTPPHADSAASAAVEAADLVLIPCRPSAFDLAAIKTTASLVKMRGKPAFVIFTAGSPTAPRMYDEAAQLVQDYGLDACPHHIADRARYLKKLQGSLKPGGRLAIIDFRMVSPDGPPKSARITPDRVKTELKGAGYALIEEHAFLPNPYFISTLKHLDGTDPRITDFLLSRKEAKEFLERFRDFLDYLIPLYGKEGKSYLTIAVGCTGGRHRSVAMVEALSEGLGSDTVLIRKRHRDINKS